MFKKVLIANRGEIAIRVAVTLQQMGIEVAAVYSEEDKNALHLRFANEAYPLADSYLNEKNLIEIAKSCSADAVHPGYGFLSENASFAASCKKAGLIFIGPSPDAIELLGDKLRAKELARKIGVPIIPGTDADAPQNLESFTKSAQDIGYPVLIKAAAGGGGKGMRLVKAPSELAQALDAAKREAKAAFGDARVFLEKAIEKPRHVEFQIFGDEHGHLVHLFERECSIQRRYQKIVEESPSPALSPPLREAMGKAAVELGKAAGYTNAGTVEFIVDQNGNFYFLEMNTRLQVEHPVTEAILGLDLVRLQVETAAGEKLTLHQDSLIPRGHAIECRVYAENPAKDFLPSAGTIEVVVPPQGPNIRIDSGVSTKSKVSVQYDPLLAKVITWGESREIAIERMRFALSHFVILGITTNLEFLQAVVGHPQFRKGNLHTGFISEHAESLHPTSKVPSPVSMAVKIISESKQARFPIASAPSAQIGDPWNQMGEWRLF